MGLLDMLAAPSSQDGLLRLIADRHPKMALRPFNPDEFINNEDGSISTERTWTIQTPEGDFANVPSLWMGNNGPVDLATQSDPEPVIMNMMRMYEAENGPTWQRFKTVEEAENYARSRSNQGGSSSHSHR